MAVVHTWVAGDRWYLDETTGNKAPGVSAINDIVSKPQLDGARLKLAAQYAVDNTEPVAQVAAGDRDAAIVLVRDAAKREWGRKAAEGTRVHGLCEQLMRDLLAGRKSTFNVTEDDKRYLRNYARFIRDFEVEPVYVEQTIWSEDHDYAGQLDLGCWMTIDGKRVLCDVDTKTGASGVWAEAAVQQAAYIYADHIVNPDGEIVDWPEVGPPTRAFALWLRPNGWALLPLDTGANTWSEFLRRRGCYEWRLTQEKRVIGAGINDNPLRKQWRGKT